MISVQYCSESPQHFGFCHYPYVAWRIKNQTLANKIIHIQKCLNIAKVFLFPVSKTTILSLVYIWNFLLGLFFPSVSSLPGSQKPIKPSSQAKPSKCWHFRVCNPFYRLQRVYLPYLSNLTSYHSSLFIPSGSTRLTKVSLTYQTWVFHSHLYLKDLSPNSNVVTWHGSLFNSGL